MKQSKERKLSLVEVALAVANSMIGLSLLYFPELFMQSGLVVGVISLIVLGAMMSYTCSLWSEHLNPSEGDIGDIVLRVLKNKMYIIFSLSSGIALCLLTTAIFLMINQLIYVLLIQLLQAANTNTGFRKDTKGIHFQQFSIQYLGIILLIPFGLLMALKSIKKVLLITRFASLLMLLYLVQVVAFFIQNLTTDRVTANGIKLFPSNLSETIGLLSTVLFAFISHPSVSPILKNAKNPLANTKSIYIAYIFATVLFSLIGIFGGIGLIGRTREGGNSVISYFSGQALSYTMGIPILAYLASIFSIYPFVARNQLLSLLQFFTKKPNLKQKYHYHFSALLILMILLASILNLNPALIISFIGAVMCWLACFLFPCLIRLKQGKPVYDIQSLISEEEMIPQRIRVSRKEKIWIYLVIATGSLLMVAEFYYVIDGLISGK